MSNGARILLCDDHELVRDGLRHVLSDAFPDATIGEAAAASDVLSAIERETWDLLILDINLGERSGLDLLREVKQRCTKLPVLILSIYPEAEFAVRVFRLGAAGYLNKNLARKTLVEAVRVVLSGRPFISPQVADQLAASINETSDQPAHLRLSTREDQVMRGIAAGQTVSELAAQLHLSVSTVSTYRAKVLEKLKLENNAQIMRYVQEHRLAN